MRRIVTNATNSVDTSSYCVICQDQSINDNYITLEGCTHKFHSNCIIQWFRSGQQECPQCRNVTIPSYLAMSTRLTILRRQSKQKKASTELKKLVKRLELCEQKYKDVKTKKTQFKKENAKIFSSYASLRRKYHTCSRNARLSKRELASYMFPHFIT